MIWALSAVLLSFAPGCATPASPIPAPVTAVTGSVRAPRGPTIAHEPGDSSDQPAQDRGSGLAFEVTVVDANDSSVVINVRVSNHGSEVLWVPVNRDSVHSYMLSDGNGHGEAVGKGIDSPEQPDRRCQDSTPLEADEELSRDIVLERPHPSVKPRALTVWFDLVVFNSDCSVWDEAQGWFNLRW